MADDRPHITVESRGQWRDWLAVNHATSTGIWLITYKKSSGRPHVPYDDIVDEAIAFGWVDSRPGSLDEQRSKRLVAPRKPTSNWSRVNKRRVERLMAAGRMTPAGLAAVKRAQDNGAWTALDAVEELQEPEDLRDALDRDADARRHWDAFPRSTKRAILEWIAGARTTPTRDRRIAQTAELAAQDIRANQWRQPKGRKG